MTATVTGSAPSGSVGTSVTFTANSTGCTNPVYEFWLRDPSGRWSLRRTFGTTTTWIWDTHGWAKGSYLVHVWANSPQSDYSTWQAWGEAAYSVT